MAPASATALVGAAGSEPGRRKLLRMDSGTGETRSISVRTKEGPAAFAGLHAGGSATMFTRKNQTGGPTGGGIPRSSSVSSNGGAAGDGDQPKFASLKDRVAYFNSL